MYNVIFDMETNDIDDYLTLCFLCSHKEVNLLGVGINPGSPEQVGIVRYVLEKHNKNIRIGVPDIYFRNIRPLAKDNAVVNPMHFNIIGKVPYSAKAENVSDMMKDIITKYPDTIVLTGGPLVNLSKTVQKYPNLIIENWYGQGGFAGINVIDKKDELPKFKDKILCRTFNLGVSPKDSLIVVNHKNIKNKHLISKNVCHGMFYNRELHDKLNSYKKDNIGLNMIYEAMKIYVEKKKKDKLIHDLLACATIFNDKVCVFKEVELYFEDNMWGSKISKTPNVNISVSVNKEEFYKTFLGY